MESYTVFWINDDCAISMDATQAASPEEAVLAIARDREWGSEWPDDLVVVAGELTDILGWNDEDAPIHSLRPSRP